MDTNRKGDSNGDSWFFPLHLWKDSHAFVVDLRSHKVQLWPGIDWPELGSEMTRRDYIATAVVLRTQIKSVCAVKQSREARELAAAGIAGAIRGMAGVFERDNPRFDRDKFFEAAGLVKHFGEWSHYPLIGD